MMETKIFDYGMNGEGVGKIDGKVLLVANALINETVDVEITDAMNWAVTGKLLK